MSGFCKACGTQYDTGARFCARCGAPLAQPQQQYTQPPQQQYSQPQPQYTQTPVQQYAQPQQQYTQPPQQQHSQPQQQYAQPPVQQYAQPQQQYAQPQQQYSQTQGPPAMSAMQAVLANAPGALNHPGRPWAVTVEGASIVARWRWMDATFFAPHEVTDETRSFTFTVTLSENGKWKELDVTEKKSSGIKMSGGSIGFGSSSSTFKGKTNQKSFSLGVGKNNQTGQTGLIGFKFDTTSVKQPIRDYLTSQGWRKG